MFVADAPSVTDWMQGWGSILGLAMSTIAVIFSGWLLRHEINTRREEKTEAELAQARLVVGRISGCELDEDGWVQQFRYEIINYSDAPVFFVNPYIVDQEFGQEFDSEKVYHVLASNAPIVGFVSAHNCDPPDPDEEGNPDLSRFQVKLVFVDKNGLQWRRFHYEAPLRGFKDPDPSRLHRIAADLRSAVISARNRRRYRRAVKAKRRPETKA
ncbi:hypothetical protein ACQP1P_46565 [Dactylosporangium sp. CA-052675]|uniref:hypothetical protein n=1 Tax=Dactylosporangium sp. CA-052675 TaxID=3239927 RepID=UPI003D934206